jgi:hypothetical protein
MEDNTQSTDTDNTTETSTIIVPELPVRRGRGRPKGSKNKPKILVAPVEQPLFVDGLPNLPEVHLLGRPRGSRNQRSNSPTSTTPVTVPTVTE